MKQIRMKNSISALEGSWGAGTLVIVGENMTEARAAELLENGLAVEVNPDAETLYEALTETLVDEVEDLKAEIAALKKEEPVPAGESSAQAVEDVRAKLADLDYAALRALAKEQGLTFSKTPKVAELRELLVEEALKNGDN